MPVKRAPKETPVPEVKRKPGRPRKVVEATSTRALRAIAAPPEPTEIKKKPGRPKKVAATPLARVPRQGSKTEAIYKMLTRKQGCTRAEVLEKTKWPAISMQHVSGLLGLQLKQEKTRDGITRYYGNP